MAEIQERIVERVAVIGAGIAGLAAIKACREEGLHVVCYEKTIDFGGLWCYREKVIDGVGSVMRSTTSNSSKEMSAFSDFPPSPEFPNYLPHKAVYSYLEEYVRHFRLFECIAFGHEVIALSPAADYQVTGQWCLRVKAGEENREEEFDAILVCTGHLSYPFVPLVAGLDRFRGDMKHCKHCRDPDQMAGKKVLVVGAGNSAADVAVEAAAVAKEVYLSCRRGTWLLPRTGFGGLPLDLMLTRLYTGLSHLPFSLVPTVTEKLLSCWIDHNIYGLRSPTRIWDILPTINDFLPNKILCGQVVIKGGVKEFTEGGVIFEGENSEKEIDLIVFATGYRAKFSFLDKNVFPHEDPASLYKAILPPHLPHPTLAMIGFISTIGSLWPVMELQSRWVVAHLVGKATLPSKENMMKEILKREKNMKPASHLSGGRDVPFMAVRYTDDLAKDIGVKPNFVELALTDPVLCWACLTGPCLPYQYRLFGPHSWSGAREAILDYKRRVLMPLRGQIKNKREERSTDI